MSFHVSEGDLKGYSPPPGGSSRSRAMATSSVTSTISAPTDGTRPLPVRPQSRTPALHRFSGHASGESPGRPPPTPSVSSGPKSGINNLSFAG